MTSGLLVAVGSDLSKGEAGRAERTGNGQELLLTKGEPSFHDPAAARTRPNPRRFDRMPSECHFTRPRNSKS